MAEHAGSSGAERRFGIGCDSLGEQPAEPGILGARPPALAPTASSHRGRRTPIPARPEICERAHNRCPR